MKKMKFSVYKNNSFIKSEVEYTPEMVEKSLVSLEDATGFDFKIYDEEEPEEISQRRYFVGEEMDKDSAYRLADLYNIKLDREAMNEYMNTYNCNRMGVTFEKGIPLDMKPLTTYEFMTESKESLDNIYNVAAEMVTQKVLRLKRKPITSKKDVA